MKDDDVRIVPLNIIEPTRSAKRKLLELALVKEIEKHLAGLDISYIAIDLKDGVDVRVILNEVTKTTNQAASQDTKVLIHPTKKELGKGARR